MSDLVKVVASVLKESKPIQGSLTQSEHDACMDTWNEIVLTMTDRLEQSGSIENREEFLATCH